jgi:hypothetical protein
MWEYSSVFSWRLPKMKQVQPDDAKAMQAEHSIPFTGVANAFAGVAPPLLLSQIRKIL